MSLAVTDFDRWFFALWNTDPYPWQRRLVAQVAAEGRWPEQLDLPTGTGKTSALDIAVFLLALDAARPPTERRAPRRIFLVVDRRAIVDQGFTRARLLADRLAAAQGGVLGEARQRLQTLHDGTRPIETALLRGAMVRDDAWARRPDQPLLALSTVDQVGSRLLFRGYGVSPGMAPIHAGLLGRDSLYLLDEVHLSQPFEQTLTALQARYIGESDALGPTRLQVCRLSATPRESPRSRFGLDEADRAHPLLARRLQAPKPARLVLEDVKGEEADKVRRFAGRLTQEAVSLARPGATVGVIVNRVETARLVARGLQEQGREVALITGRMRPLDREREEERIQPWVKPGRDPDTDPPRFVVATQCVEAGADYDLDLLLTECAPLDALVQRFGRLNRTGLRVGAQGLILARKDQVKEGEQDPVYGEALAKTWVWLNSLESIDFSTTALQRIDSTVRASLCAHALDAPLLQPAWMDLLAQTSPAPDPSPEVALLLHGPRRPETEVQVLWRADLEDELFREGELSRERRLDALLSRLEAAPPGSLEALSLPIHTLRRWLEGRTARVLSLSDAGPSEAEEPERFRDREEPWVLRWAGEGSALVQPSALRPGDTVVLPATRGGLSLGSFDPLSQEPVTDLGDAVQLRLRGRVVLRLHPALLGERWSPELESRAPDDEELPERILSWVEALPEDRQAALGKSWRMIVHDELLPRRVTLVGRAAGRAEEASTDPETSSHTGAPRAVPLRAHLEGVGSWARRFAEHLGLPERVVLDLESAGRWHDLGKLDPRFQRWLHGGSALAAARASEPVAKSTTPAQDRASRLRARAQSGYPERGRHELQSLALLEAAGAVRAEVEARGGDWALVCHLVASHHGYCRPFAPVVHDPAPVAVRWGELELSSAHGLERLDSGVSERFWALVRRYGAHGLASLEAVLRLADHHRSALEQQGREEESP